jgi:hypothetical protein
MTVSRRGCPALDLRRQLEDRGLRVYNPRNKTAAQAGSPVFQLAALLSYLVDPVTKAPAGHNGRSVEVWASNSDPVKASYAPAEPPEQPSAPGQRFFISADHAAIQKKFLKDHGDIGAPGPVTKPLLDYLDEIRERLIAAGDAYRRGRSAPPRLTSAGWLPGSCSSTTSARSASRPRCSARRCSPNSSRPTSQRPG